MTDSHDDASSLSRVPVSKQRRITFPLAMDSERFEVLWATFAKGGPSERNSAWIEADGWKVSVPQDLTRKGTGKSHFDQVQLVRFLDSGTEHLSITIHRSSAKLYSRGQPATHTRADEVLALIEEWKPKRSFTRHSGLITAICVAALLGMSVNLLLGFLTDLGILPLVGIQLLVSVALMYPAAVWGDRRDDARCPPALTLGDQFNTGNGWSRGEVLTLLGVVVAVVVGIVMAVR